MYWPAPFKKLAKAYRGIYRTDDALTLDRRFPEILDFIGVVKKTGVGFAH